MQASDSRKCVVKERERDIKKRERAGARKKKSDIVDGSGREGRGRQLHKREKECDNTQHGVPDASYVHYVDNRLVFVFILIYGNSSR